MMKMSIKCEEDNDDDDDDEIRTWKSGYLMMIAQRPNAMSDCQDCPGGPRAGQSHTVNAKGG
jgi:hypothetical protein